MFLQRKTHHFLIFLFLVGFAAAKCVPEKCADFEVSYPFWINNSECGYPDYGFQITCRQSNSSGMMLSPYFTAFLGNFTGFQGNFTVGYYFKIMDIDYKGNLIINSSRIRVGSCDSDQGARDYFELPSGGPFTLSESNRLVVIGNQTFGTYSFGAFGESKCISLNLHSNQPYCPYGCCEINIPNNLLSVNFTGGGLFNFNWTNDSSTNVCGFSTIMDPSTFKIVDNRTNLFWGEGMKASYGLRLNWGLGDQNCATAKTMGDYACSSKAKCLDSPSGKGYVCECLPGYQGNGYSNGTDCKDKNECSPGQRNMCIGAGEGGICHNLAGSYNCSCANGYKGDGFRNQTECISTRSNRLIFAAIIGSVSSFVVVCLAASLFVCWLKKRHFKQLEAKYYQQLQQHIASAVGRESLRIFSAKELSRASNNYSEEMVLGSGGFGTVFKGILTDDTIVAIKKSNHPIHVEDDHEFLNEVTILSQINHRNIVKLLGCCIQTKFPMLVSEFVSNGTLFQHLHFKEQFLSWASRLQIAIDTGEALAYLHSGASQPIFHRDVKSSNILLNEKLSPRVADFGISRLISTNNNTHVTTNNIVGTRGYLDPEYFQTYQLTEKSDVYSFGVVLVELLTSLKPICIERANHEWSLSSLFLSRLNNNRLREILDIKISEENLQQMEGMASIARECLHFERRKRPTMKEVVEELICVRDDKRKTKFHGSVKSEDTMFEQTRIPREALQTSYEFRSYTFPSTVESTSEEPFTALIQMSDLAE